MSCHVKDAVAHEAETNADANADGAVGSVPERKEISQHKQQMDMEAEQNSSYAMNSPTNFQFTSEKAASTSSARDFTINEGQSGNNLWQQLMVLNQMYLFVRVTEIETISSFGGI